MIVWDDDTMSTGIPAIDKQHKMLIQKFNQFSEEISGTMGMQTAGEILDFLQFYAIWHFRQEEDCMNEYKCPVAGANKEAHAEFLVTFGQFYEQWQTGNMTPQLANDTYIKLEKWLLHHVAQVDTQLRWCVKDEAELSFSEESGNG